jgi:uncharacterized membrane protein
MKPVPLKLPAQKAKKELSWFMKAGYAAAIIGFFILPSGFGLVATIFGLRCSVLTYNPAIKKQSNIMKLRVASFALVLLGVLVMASSQFVKK